MPVFVKMFLLVLCKRFLEFLLCVLCLLTSILLLQVPPWISRFLIVSILRQRETFCFRRLVHPKQ